MKSMGKEELEDLLFKQSIRENIEIIKSIFEAIPLIYFI
ncbi:hypothetical protein CLPUN_00550 [Clostridium puniceum]|uniref:Uncharacterized protein n=1 Tax=Clostridium puniceum TaxID=29367 RepID=A0A1S8TXV7_9CLOT|nr:hypothetical protein CLPUN_00550 [Clostridium puniceum]